MDRFSQVFNEVPLAEVHDLAARRAEEGWRYVQILAVNTEEGIDLVYSYMKDGLLDNAVIEALPKDAEVPSITDLYLEAFVCENEIHDLFGITFKGLAIDFLGNFYRVSTDVPMTIISPEKLAEREKQRKLAEKKAKAEAAKQAKEAAAEGSSDASDADPQAASADAELEAKLAAMSPERAAKVRAAMEAKAAKAKKDTEGEGA